MIEIAFCFCCLTSDDFVLYKLVLRKNMFVKNQGPIQHRWWQIGESPSNAQLVQNISEGEFLFSYNCVQRAYNKMRLEGSNVTKVLLMQCYTWQNFGSQGLCLVKKTLLSYSQDAIPMNQNFAMCNASWILL